MRGIFMGRGKGKTTALVCASAVTGYPILVQTVTQKGYVLQVAKNIGVKIPDPICRADCRCGAPVSGVLVDNAEWLIQEWIAEHIGAPVVAYTATASE